MSELPINVVRLKTPEGEMDVVTPFPEAYVGAYGLPPEAVIGKLTQPFDPAKPVITPDVFSRNATFVEFMHALIARHAPQLPGVLTTVGSEPGRIFVIDERTRAPDKSIPGRDVIGAFEFRDGQIVPGSYAPNKDHWILSQDGFFQLPGELQALLIKELRSLRPLEELTLPLPKGKQTLAAAERGEVDPLEEADAYLAYGRYPQAKLILEEALWKDPSRADIRARLRKIRADHAEWVETFLLNATIAALPLTFVPDGVYLLVLPDLFWPTLVRYVVLLPIPWIFLWLCWKQPDRFDQEVKGFEAVAVTVCGVFLAFRVMLDFELNAYLHLGPLFAVAAIAVLPMLACLLWLQPHMRRTLPWMAGNALLGALMLYPYHVAVVAYVNEKLDRREPKVHWIQIQEKWELPDRRRGPTRGLVADWSLAGITYPPRVSKEVFAAAKEGTPICVLVFSGALKVPWYTLKPPADCMQGKR